MLMGCHQNVFCARTTDGIRGLMLRGIYQSRHSSTSRGRLIEGHVASLSQNNLCCDDDENRGDRFSMEVCIGHAVGDLGKDAALQSSSLYTAGKRQ